MWQVREWYIHRGRLFIGFVMDPDEDFLGIRLIRSRFGWLLEIGLLLGVGVVSWGLTAEEWGKHLEGLESQVSDTPP